MYLPSAYEESRIDVLHGLMRAHPLGALAALRDGAIVVDHIPFLVDATAGELGTLHGHVARANPLWRELADGRDCVVVFAGPDAYISPAWYPGKREHGRVVPTWNYAVVHARGTPRVFDDADRVRAHLAALTAIQEKDEPEPWQLADAPEDFVAGMIGHVVGIEMPIASLEGKWKVGQNRSTEDRAGVVAGLRRRGDAAGLAMAALVEATIASSAKIEAPPGS